MTKVEPTCPECVPSCDSPELAAIKAAWLGAEPTDRNPAGDLRTLLRMVEELTVKERATSDLRDFALECRVAAEKERDELRAKLAESERAWRTWNENMSKEASKWEQRCGELTAYRDSWKRAAKVFWRRASDAEERAAFADEGAANMIDAFASMRDRAEAAEARCREMSQGQWVGGKKVGISDPDDGWMTPNVKIPPHRGNE